jgi:aminopeptidase N
VNSTGLIFRRYLAVLMPAVAALAAPPEPRPYHVASYDVTLQPNLTQRIIRGVVTLEIVALKDNLAGIDLDASDTMIIACGQGRRRFPCVRTNDILHVDLPHPLKTNQKIEIAIRYESTPQTGVRFWADQMYTVFSTSHWLPCNDRPSDRAVFTLHVIAPAGLTVVASGEFVSAHTGKIGTISTWRTQHPISTYVAGFAVGRFATHSDRDTAFSGQGTHTLGPASGLGTVTYLISPEFREPAAPEAAADPAKKKESPAPSTARATAAENIFSTTRAAASFFADKAGERYPGKAYTFVFTTTESEQEVDQFTLLSQRYFADLSHQPDDAWLLAHELAHQWWGISVTCTDWSDFWLNEGMATYLADAFLEKQYSKARYDKEIEHSHEVYREALINGQDRPLSYHEWTKAAQAGGPLPYHKGAWFLHLLREQMGDDQFWRGLRLYTRGNWQRSVDSHTFQIFLERSCRCNLQNLFNEYVY